MQRKASKELVVWVESSVFGGELLPESRLVFCVLCSELCSDTVYRVKKACSDTQKHAEKRSIRYTEIAHNLWNGRNKWKMK